MSTILDTSIQQNQIILSVQHLKKRYSNGVEAVRDISFELKRGEILGFLGPNGAGKTTTIEILNGFRGRDGGDISMFGELDPQKPADLKQLRQRIGVVLQQTANLRYLTVRETIEMHRSYHENPYEVDELLELVDLKEANKQYVRELSGGQQRRLDVAVALVGRPQLLFLDEPTTGFDPGVRRRMWQIIRDLANDGMSVLLTTHYMEEASELSDRVIVLRRGEVVGEGTPDDLAHMLNTGSTLSATLPQGISLHDFPADLRAGVNDDKSKFELQVKNGVTQLVSELCQWALENKVELDDLDVRSPSLEASYLALTGGDDK